MLALFVSFLLMPTCVLSQTPLTKPEKTGYRETSVYADVIDFLREVQLAATVEVMRTGTFGTTHEGRDMPYVVLSKPVVTRPGQALQSGKPIVFIMNNIHGGETERQGSLAHAHPGYHPGQIQPLARQDDSVGRASLQY